MVGYHYRLPMLNVKPVTMLAIAMANLLLVISGGKCQGFG